MKRLSLLAVSMLLTCTLFAADIFLRGSVNGWGASDDFKFATSDNVVYTLEKSFDLFGEFKFGDANWGDYNYGSGGGAVELDTPLKLAPGGGNFNCGSNSYKVTKIVLNLLENSATIYGEGGELEITSWTVCGSAAVMGSEFDPTDTSNDMVFVGGVYQLQKKSVALAADAIYEYKFTGNHAWGVGQYPESMENLEFTVSADGTYNVTFSWNPATKVYGVVPESVTPPTPPVDFDTYILVGDAALFYVDWTPSPIGVDRFTLETTDGINYSKSVNNVPISKAGTFAYGFSKNGSTTDILFKDKTKTVTIEEAGTYNVSVSLIVAPGEEPDAEAILTKVVEPKYYIAGNGDATTDWCCGASWTADGCPMEAGYFTRDLPAGEYKFKITDGTWNNSWGYDAVDPSQSTPGYDTDTDGNVVFTLAEYSTVAVNFDGSKITLQWIKKDEPVVFDTWTLVGDMPPFPAAWDATMAAFDLQTTDGVVYTLVADDVDMTVDKFQYGFRKNHTEDFAPLEAKYTATLAEGTGSYKVEITIDFSATPVVPQVEFTKNVAPVVYDYYIAGDGSAETGWTCGLFWQADGCGMADGAYAAKVPAGTYSFKVTQGDWDKDSFGYESVDATASTPGYVNAGGNVQFTVSAEANIGVTFNGTAIVLTSDVPFGEATIKTWTIAGQEELMGVFWDPKVESNDMAKDGDVYKLTRSNVSLVAGEYQYKACANHSWNIATVPADDSNMILAIDEDGVYTVVFTLDADKAKLSATATKQVVVFDTWTLVGDMPPFPVAWTAIPAFDLQTTDGVIYTLVADDVDMPVETFQYGFVKNHDMSQYAPLEEKYTAKLTDGTGNYKVEIRIDFTDTAAPDVKVNFTKNPEPPVGGITVNVTVPANTPACFFYGEMSGNTFVEMTKVDDTHYTTKFADKESIGWGYLFCWESGNFSTKDIDGDFTVEPVDGVINVEVTGWQTEPGTSYKYTTYTDWQVKTDWDGGDWIWLTLNKESDGVFSATAPWGSGTGLNLGTVTEQPIKKDWYPAGDPALTIASGLVVGQEVKVTLTVVDDENVKISVTPEGAPTFDTWTLVGDMPPFPAAWDATMASFDLQTTDGVIYTMVEEDVDMTVDKFQYGFRKNHTDEYAPLEAKYTATLAEGVGNYKVEITIDFSATPVVPQVEFTKNPEPPVGGITVNVTVPANTPACFFYGEMSGNTFVEMTKVDDTHYTTKFADKESIGWGYLFCWESGNFSTKDIDGDFTVEPVDGVINVEVTGWLTEPGTEYKYTTYTDWKVKSDWNGDWDTAEWLTLTKVSDGVFEGEAAWGTGPGVNLGSESGPVKKDWYPAGDPALTIASGLVVGQEVKVTLTVVDDENVKISVTPEGAPTFDTWTLVGDMPPFPAAWDATMASFDLQTTDGVIYTMVEEDVDMTVDKFQYGFRKNHTDEYAPLEAKYTATLAEGTGSYKVEITLDFTVATDPKVTVNFTKNVTPTYDYYIAGNGDGLNGWTCGITWDPAGCGMAEGQYAAHVQPGTYEFKITNGKWATEGGKDWGVGAVDAIKSTPGYEGTDNVRFSVSSEANITVSFDGTSIILLSDVPFGEATITSWTAVGEAGLFENAWTPTDESNDMQFVGGVYQLVKTGLTLEAKNYLYKFTANHTWSVSEIPSGNATLTIAEAGTYKVTFSLNPATGEHGAVPEKETPTSADEAVEDSIYATNGTVFCSTPFEVYNLVGQNVTAQNGSLFGIYIVKTANAVKTISVK